MAASISCGCSSGQRCTADSHSGTPLRRPHKQAGPAPARPNRPPRRLPPRGPRRDQNGSRHVPALLGQQAGPQPPHQRPSSQNHVDLSHGHSPRIWWICRRPHRPTLGQRSLLIALRSDTNSIHASLIAAPPSVCVIHDEHARRTQAQRSSEICKMVLRTAAFASAPSSPAAIPIRFAMRGNPCTHWRNPSSTTSGCRSRE